MKSSQFSLLHLIAISAPAFCKTILLEHGTVIGYDEQTELPKPLYDTSILIKDDRIQAIFSADDDSVTVPQDAERVNVEGRIVTPGFVDTHHHGWQTAYKTIMSNTTLGEYLLRYGDFSQANTVFTADDIFYGELVGYYEAVNSGITSVLDHDHGTFSRNHTEAALKAIEESGVRTWFCPAIHELGNGFSVQEQMDTIRDIAGQTDRVNQSSVAQLGLAYDGFTANPKEEVQAVMAMAKSIPISVFTTHQVAGVFLEDNGPTLLNSLDFLNTSFPIIFSHATSYSTSDALLLRQYNHYISTTPESEMHTGMDDTNAWLIQDQASLGVDTHSGFSSNIVHQARLWLQNLRRQLYQFAFYQGTVASTNPMSVNQAFHLATRSGALALRRGQDLGVIREGAKADLVVFDGMQPSMLGWSDPVAAVILHSNVGDIEHVLVDGEWRKRDFKLVVKGGEARRRFVQREFLKSAKRIQSIWKDTPPPDLSGLYFGAIPYGDTPRADVVRGSATGY